MSKQIEALKLALVVLELSNANHWWGSSSIEKAITAIREALAEQPAQQQEPVATWENKYGMKEWQVHALRAGWSLPASKPWVGLTDEEYSQLHDGFHQQGKLLGWVVDQVETKLREKNA